LNPDFKQKGREKLIESATNIQFRPENGDMNNNNNNSTIPDMKFGEHTVKLEQTEKMKKTDLEKEEPSVIESKTEETSRIQ
jgi:hypothetical protein